MLLNFDFTFLTVLLSPAEGAAVSCRHRCHVPPFPRKCMCEDPALELAADESVILSYWKLRDTVADEGFWRGLPARALSWLLLPGYRKAARARPEFDQTVRQQLKKLGQLEKERCASLDRPADAFACLLQAAAPDTGDAGQDRAMGQLLYHLGRWIYLLDAQDDLEEDRDKGRYNPVLLRFGPEGDTKSLGVTLEHSLNLMRSACALLPLGRQQALVENVLYLGLPLVQRAVFEGSWAQIKKQKIWRTNE